MVRLAPAASSVPVHLINRHQTDPLPPGAVAQPLGEAPSGEDDKTELSLVLRGQLRRSILQAFGDALPYLLGRPLAFSGVVASVSVFCDQIEIRRLAPVPADPATRDSFVFGGREHELGARLLENSGHMYSPTTAYSRVYYLRVYSRPRDSE